MSGPAGSLWITHLDVIHAAGINLTDRVRHMIKFIYVQRSERTAPSWNCTDDRWNNPDDLQSPWDLEVAWSHTWDWMCGKQDRYQSFHANHDATASGDVAALSESLTPEAPIDEQLAAIRQLALFGPAASEAIPALIALLNKEHQAARAAATYALGAIGEAVIPPLIELIREAGENGWEDGVEPCWGEGCVSMMDEAHALAAIGAPAVAPLVELVDTAGEWGRINAIFALAEMDSQAAGAIPALIRCLDDPSHRIVRTALDALGTIGGEAATAVTRMSRFLSESNPEWEEVLTGKRRWIAMDQVRVNAAEAMGRLGSQAAAAEEALVAALEDECGYVGLYATDALQHLGSPSAKKAVMDLVMAQRWDCSLSEKRPW
jgi:HEAT repeat protein